MPNERPGDRAGELPDVPASVIERQQRIARQRERRALLRARRDVGLEARHRAKLARLNGSGQQ